MSGNAFGRIVRLVARRPLPVLAVTLLLALGGGVLALRLDTSAATDTLVGRSSDSFKETERYRRDFGDEAVVVLVQGELTKTVLTTDLLRVLGLEGCLGGNIPEDDLQKALAEHRKNPAKGLPPACGEIAKLRPAKAVYGPATFINTSAAQISDEYVRRSTGAEKQARRAANAARKISAARGDPPAEQERLAKAASEAVMTRFQLYIARLALKFGFVGIPSINNPEFVSRVVFSDTQPGVPKARFGYLFPSKDAALIQIRMRPELTDVQRRRAIELVEEAASARVFQPREGARYVVTGVPVVTERLAGAVRDSIVILLVAALLVMAATLAFVFRTRLRLLPLVIALAAAGMTFGALSLAGGSLTMASIAVLPVLIGLAVDYAIQFQARFDEQRGRRRRTGDDVVEDAAAAAAVGGPTIVTAGVATAVGFLVLLLSPVPMVRGFGLLLVVGILIALVLAIVAGFAALVRFGGGSPRPPRVRGARLEAFGERLAGRAWRALGVALARPRKVLAIALAVAVLGLVLDSQSAVESDIQKLVPQDLQALRDVDDLQDATGVSGEIDVAVRADDITRPEVLRWMTAFQSEVLRAHGYRAGKRCTQGEGAPELCPALSLTDLFGSAGADQAKVRKLLRQVPPYFSQGVISKDRRTASLAFGIRLMPLARQKEVVDDIKDRLDPPEGVSAAVVGLPVLAAEANGALSSPLRRGLTLLAALAGVFLVLLAVRRSPRAAAVPLIPIALATGWSGLVLFVLGLLPGPLEVELNPMSVTLGALVIAISTEFSVLLSARYRQERENGAGPARAVELAYASTGAAVLASGATAIAGFAALAASDIRMLRDFGIVTVVDLTVSLLGVMLVLPAALVWAEEHGPFSLRDLDPRPLLREARARRTPADAP
ncbi:MAG: MMPL family transporter [Thermoleophilaceae bacterium]|nr:MMPL family transporter [Thermoleophilaceae bacterium]